MSTGPRLLCNARKGRHRLPLGSRTHGCPTGRVCVSSADGGARIDDLATQSADDALVALLAKLDDYRGDSRFTTWAYKFALLEAAVKLRRRAWQGREVPVEADGLSHLGGEDARADHTAETAELLHELGAAIDSTLTPHQRDVLVSLTLNGVPIDVLAAHLNTTRGALYKTLHDARRKLRADASGQGPRAGLPIGRMNDVGDKELRMILGTPGPDVGCDACFDQLDRYVEAEVAGKDADAGGSPADWHVFFQAQTLGLLAVALAIVAGVRVAAARWPGIDLPALAKLVDWMPLVVRLHLAGALIMQPALGFFITPSLPLPAGALGGLFAALMVVPAVLLIVGWNMRLAAGLVIATLPVAAMHYGAWAALGRADIVGAAAFCAILGAGPWSLERRLSGRRPRSFDAHLRAMWCLRMALGLALLIAAFAEKLAHPDIALMFLADHGDFNVAAMIGLPVSDLEFTRVVGVIEIMTALLVMSGAMPQVILPFTIMPFIATLLQLGDVELAGHFSAHGALIATVVYASHPQLRRTVYHLWPWPPVGGRSARRVAPATDPVAATAAAR